MRKFIWFILTMVSLSVILVACNSGESYADKLKNEKKEIEKFLSENNIKVLGEYPGDGYNFAENEYYLDASGTYIRVINWGDKDYMATSTPRTTTVSMRFDNTRYLGDTTIWQTVNSGADFFPMEIEYGDANTYVGTYPSGSSLDSEGLKYMFMSVPCTIPLEYVGNKGEVSLIVPFVNGSYYQRSSAYKAVYFGMLRYTFLD